MFGKRFSRALAVTTAATLIMASAAFADELLVDGDNLTPFGSTLALGNVQCGVATSGTARLTVQRTTNGNPNIFKDLSTATVSVLSTSVTGLSAAMPAAPANQITFPAGWEATSNNIGATTGAVSASVTINSTTPGVGSGTVTFQGSGTNANNAAMTKDATLTVTWTTGSCAPANTPPQVLVLGPADGATYEFGSVPAAGCSVVDAEDTNESATPVLGAISGPLAAYGLGTQAVGCSYTDGGGLSDNDSVTYTVVDTGKPMIEDLGPTTTPNGANGWYTSAVTNEFEASDSGAGFLLPLTNPHTLSPDSGTNEGSAVTIASGSVSDVAGNTATSINSAAFKIDLSDPYNVAFVGGPAAGSSHYFGSVPAAPTCTADDDISQVASCDVTGYSSAVGNHTMTATATDNAGRTANLQRSYTVLAWTPSGFYRPVDMSTETERVWNTIKGGQTVPLKFNLYAGSTELTETSRIASFKTTLLTCASAIGEEQPVEITTTGGTSLRYDTTGAQFIQNWQTPKTSGKCYVATVTFQDGSSISAYFKTK